MARRGDGRRAGVAADGRSRRGRFRGLADFDFRIAPDDDGFGYTLNIQPVIPVSLTEDWNLISRTILPLIQQDEIFLGAGDQLGLGDTLQSLFVSPRQPGSGGLIWGWDPAILLPRRPTISWAGEVGARAPPPSFCGRKDRGPWASSPIVWSFAGDDDRPDVNETFLQPFAAYTFPNAVSITAQTETTYDWEGEVWAVPVALGVSKVLTVGARPVSLARMAGEPARWRASRRSATRTRPPSALPSAPLRRLRVGSNRLAGGAVAGRNPTGYAPRTGSSCRAAG